MNEINKFFERKVFIYKLIRTGAVVSAIFGLTVSILVLAHYFQTKAVEPLNNPALQTLMTHLDENPQDQDLKEQIRALDLRARKAFFLSHWQIRTGGFLIFGSGVLFFLCMRIMEWLKGSLPFVEKETPDPWKSASLSRKWLSLIGGLIVVIALLFTFISHSELDKMMFPPLDENISGTLSSAPSEEEGKDGFLTFEDLKAHWPSFRGPGGYGVAFFTNIPTDWDGPSGRNILWKTEITDPGFSSPIRWGDRLFLSGGNKTFGSIFCVDTHTGKILWQKNVTGIPGSPKEMPEVSQDTGYAAPTMTTDGTHVYAIFANGDLVCFDFDGNPVWAKNLGVPDNHYGHSSSLIMHQNRLIVQYDHKKDAHLYGFDALTGEVVWKTVRDVQVSWSSPILVNTGKREEVIINANPFVTSYDPLTGKELWRLQGMSGEVAPSPAFADGRVFAVNEYAVMMAIQVGDIPKLIWEDVDFLSEVASPLATDKYVFVPTSYGDLACLDALTGDENWYHAFDDGFYSSPILVEDKIYIIDLTGVMHIVKADKEFQLIGSPVLGEEVVTTPAFDHGRIYIRGVKTLFCIGS